jgi:hypothetical protein
MMIRTVCPSCRATLSLDADDVVLAIRGELSVDDLVDLYLMLADERRSDTLLVSSNLTGQRTQSSTLDGRAVPDLTRNDRS